MDKKRFEEIDKTIDSSMRMKLNQIRTYLDLRKASVMVGAGFSKNAEMGEDVYMKSWNELCEDFYMALYGLKPCDKDLRLKSALRLAQQIESTKGRTALDEIIKTALPNDSISPGYLHRLLVSLNWRDIFTTNYDSLLEDAAVREYRHYNVVTSKDTLIYQPHPRIVKLHGSFPDNRPFIITEEDYRTYPDRFPEFVNTIRQALIETQFCLIGFSGDDPNFLSWLGWFRDIMGKQMLPIYLIYVGSRPHDSELKLLSYRKVEPIITEDISMEPAEALDFILSYVGNVFAERGKWSGALAYRAFDKSDLKGLIGKMRQIRESYPGWMIMPADRVESDFADCRTEFPFMGKAFSQLDEADRLDFLYEYTWRLQTSFMPFWLNTEWYLEALQEILNRYDAIDVKDRKKADYLSVSFLQILRIAGDSGFSETLQLFRSRISPNNTALHRRLKYEEALWALSHCDHSGLEKILTSWNTTPDDYLGALWKSRVLMEIDRDNEAAKILEESLGNVRRKLMSDSKSEYQLSAAAVLSDCLAFKQHCSGRDKDIDERFRFRKYYDLCKGEIQTEEKSGVTHTHGFNIGAHGTSWSSGENGYIRRYVGACRFYLLCETYGRPVGSKFMTYNSDFHQSALPLISGIRLETSLLYLIESNDRKALNAALSRQTILNISEKEATELYDSWIKVLEPYMGSAKKENVRRIREVRELNVVLPMLVRLCVWLDYERILRIVKFIWDVSDSHDSDSAELLRTCYNSLPKDKAIELWWEAMERNIVPDLRSRDLAKPNVYITEWKGSHTTVKIITEGLSDESADKRNAAVGRLCDIHTLLPREYQEEIDAVILANFDNLLNTILIPLLGLNLQPDEDRVWKERFMTYLNEQVTRFIASDFNISGSSSPIDRFDDFITTFIDCHRHLSEEETNGIVKKVLDFVKDNYAVFQDTHDSESMLGGLKRFLDTAMKHIGDFMERVDLSLIQSELRNELVEIFKPLNEFYPLLRTIVRLSLTAKPGSIGESAKENRQFVKRSLERDVISFDHNRMSDAFHAAADCLGLAKGNFSIQEIVKSAIDHIRYHLDGETSYILYLLPIWIERKIIAKQNLKGLFDVLSTLSQRAQDARGVSAEQKADMLYYGGLLAGRISKTEFPEAADKAKCVEAWQSFADSNACPRDIRNGYLYEL